MNLDDYIKSCDKEPFREADQKEIAQMLGNKSFQRLMVHLEDELNQQSRGFLRSANLATEDGRLKALGVQGHVTGGFAILEAIIDSSQPKEQEDEE